MSAHYEAVCRQNVDRQNVEQTKCWTDKMSTDKMSNRQNVEQTKCRTDKMSTEKMPNRQNVDNFFFCSYVVLELARFAFGRIEDCSFNRFALNGIPELPATLFFSITRKIKIGKIWFFFLFNQFLIFHVNLHLKSMYTNHRKQ